jgi:hypothetical protein
MPSNAAAGRHHATYILVQGVWVATCRDCGHKVSDPRRRAAASLFRKHIRDPESSGTQMVLHSEPALTEIPEMERTRET